MPRTVDPIVPRSSPRNDKREEDDVQDGAWGSDVILAPGESASWRGSIVTLPGRWNRGGDEAVPPQPPKIHG